MDDIKIRKLQRVPREKSVRKSDLSFLQTDSGSAEKLVKNIEAPNRFPKRVWLAMLLAIFFLGLGILISNYLPWLQDTSDQDLQISVERASGEGESVSLFNANLFYKVSLVDGSEYYSRVAEAGPSHYRLTEIFYATSTPKIGEKAKVGEVAGDSDLKSGSLDKIILIKYGTEPDRVSDELLVPREQMVSFSPLVASSPILAAIADYLAE